MFDRVRRFPALLAALTLLLGCTGAAASAQAGQDILILGSSTTACTGPTDAAHCYVNLIRSARPTDTVTAIGRGGTYVGYGTPAQNWTQTIIPGSYDTVVIQLGVNDWYVPVAPAVYRTHLDDLLGRVRAANPDARILWLATWMPEYTPASPDTRPAMWQDHGVTLVAALNAVGGDVIDMHATGSRREAAPYRADPASGWHYNNRGHQLLADAVLARL